MSKFKELDSKEPEERTPADLPGLKRPMTTGTIPMVPLEGSPLPPPEKKTAPTAGSPANKLSFFERIILKKAYKRRASILGGFPAAKK